MRWVDAVRLATAAVQILPAVGQEFVEPAHSVLGTGTHQAIERSGSAGSLRRNESERFVGIVRVIPASKVLRTMRADSASISVKSAFNTGADFRYANNTLRPDDCRAHARAMFARTWVICTFYWVFQVAGFLVREGL